MFSCVTAGTIHDPAERCLRSAIRDPAERRHNKTANMKQHGRYPRPHGMTSALLDPLVLFPRETRTRLVDQSCLETGGSEVVWTRLVAESLPWKSPAKQENGQPGKEPCEQNPRRLNMFSCVTAGTIHDPAERCLRSAIRDPAERRHNKTANMKQHGRYPRPHGMTSALLDPLVLFPRKFETRTRLVDQSCLETEGSKETKPGRWLIIGRQWDCKGNNVRKTNVSMSE